MSTWFILTPEDVLFIHDRVILPHELQGQAGHKSLSGAIARVEARVQYGLLNDVYDLAAAYGVVIATGHLFNDANKRTAFQVMRTC
jgi:death-on-curing protein